jgi:thiol-disulfide isomerase/thioredoxin
LIFITQESDLQFDCKCVFYFYATWMPFNNKMLNILDKLERKYIDTKFFAIDVEVFKNICKRFSIDNIPVILLMNKGYELQRINGFVLNSALKHAFLILNLKG